MYFMLSRSSDKQRLHITVVKTFHGFNALVSLINIEALFNTRAVALVQVKIGRSELSRGELSGGQTLGAPEVTLTFKVCDPGDQKYTKDNCPKVLKGRVASRIN